MRSIFTSWPHFIVFAIGVHVIASTALEAYQDRAFGFKIWRMISLPMLGQMFLVVVYIAFIAISLIYIAPFTQYGWLHLVYAGGGNATTAPFVTLFASSDYGSIIVGLFFLVALTACFPYLARVEEQVFRKAVLTTESIIKNSIVFGLIHCVVGVPLAFGVALILLGLVLGFSYRNAVFRFHEATQKGFESLDRALDLVIAQHTAYNTLIIVICIAFISFYKI